VGVTPQDVPEEGRAGGQDHFVGRQLLVIAGRFERHNYENMFSNIKRLGLLARCSNQYLVNARRCAHQKSFKEHVKFIFDNPLPLGAGALVVGILQLRRIRERDLRKKDQTLDSSKDEESDIFISCYQSLPLRHVSRAWGFINDIYLPKFSRKFLLGLYARSFNCDLSEAEEENLENYENLGQFFRRCLKKGCRSIDSERLLVSPCDGKILHKGTILSEGLVEQVKGVSYRLSRFLGPSVKNIDVISIDVKARNASEDVSKDYLHNPDRNVLYQCVLYLAPGDYHRFHSPASWKVRWRRHSPGHLLSVSPSIVGRIPGLFNLNERVSYLGEWEHGFFSMTAVGATNVGSVVVDFDPTLATNQRKWERDTFHQLQFQDAVHMEKGDPFGEFNLGSTIVLIFEAPKDFAFLPLESGHSVKVGMSLCEPARECEEINNNSLEDQVKSSELDDQEASKSEPEHRVDQSEPETKEATCEKGGQ